MENKSKESQSRYKTFEGLSETYKTLKDQQQISYFLYRLTGKTEYVNIDPYYDKDTKGIVIPLISDMHIYKVNIPRDVIMECIRDCDETEEENNKDK